ncbi:hypothetical protein NA57DRAFT_57567 [Rhizodiscina lignyota]|uniref:Tudor domain-containing protein n=1 Tax=Rhizodiscina lignyota TaxID=1504668 RepID=A0A9P4M5S0_9PEZI|nr:hypothetical protein NA57DRAFT_57567 [Rhizodiscina lignyota]
MGSSLAQAEEELKEYQQQLEAAQEGLKHDPDNAALAALKSEVEEVISLLEQQIAELKPAPAPESSTPAEPEEKPKWSKENHPAFQPGFRKPIAPQSPTDAEAPVTYKVNDSVLAKWVTGDKKFYPATINSITGSKASPVYYVTFRGYGDHEKVGAADIKPLAQNSGTKRKADGSVVASPSPAPPTPTNSTVISAVANINPELANQAKKEPSKVSDGPARPAKVARKVKAGKELEAGKNKWQEFSSKGKVGKFGKKKESMFRTGEGVNARVGFTGSGQAMRKDATRTRHIYQAGENEDD